MAINWWIQEFDDVSSTQDILKDLVNDNPNLPEGLLVHACSQSSGYGRHGRVWEQGAGNLYISFLVRPDCHIDKIGQLSLLTGLALSNAIDGFIEPHKTILKWPNDIIIDGMKCSGILIDAAPIKNQSLDYVIIGVGVNIKSAPLAISTALQNYSTTDLDIARFRDTFLSCFSECYESWLESGFTKLHSDWINKTYDIGTDISVKIGNQKISGEFSSIDIDGNLLVMCNQTGVVKKITSGEVFIGRVK